MVVDLKFKQTKQTTNSFVLKKENYKTIFHFSSALKVNAQHYLCCVFSCTFFHVFLQASLKLLF